MCNQRFFWLGQQEKWWDWSDHLLLRLERGCRICTPCCFSDQLSLVTFLLVLESSLAPLREGRASRLCALSASRPWAPVGHGEVVGTTRPEHQYLARPHFKSFHAADQNCPLLTIDKVNNMNFYRSFSYLTCKGHIKIEILAPHSRCGALSRLAFRGSSNSIQSTISLRVQNHSMVIWFGSRYSQVQPGTARYSQVQPVTTTYS